MMNASKLDDAMEPGIGLGGSFASACWTPFSQRLHEYL